MVVSTQKYTCTHGVLTEMASKYALLMDSRQWDALPALFAEEVDIDFPDWTACPRGATAGAQWASFCRAGLSGFEATQHLITNHVIEIDEASAMVHAAMTARHVFSPTEIEHLGGFYDFGFSRQAGQWKISAVKLTVTWEEGPRDLFARAYERGQARLASPQ